MSDDEYIKIFSHLAHYVQQEFAARKLTDGDLMVFYRGALCQVLEGTISDTDYSEEDVRRTLKSISSNLETAIKKGWELRKTPKVD